MKKFLMILAFQPLCMMGQTYSNNLVQRATNGDHSAMLDLGWCYENSQGVSKDLGKARHWYALSAEQGNTIAMNNLGLLYWFGRGVPQDYALAFHWFSQGAEKRDMRCQYWLGRCYAEGKGNPVDATRAISLLKASAQQNFPSAMYYLGCLNEEGNLIPQNYAEAVQWYSKAAQLGDVEAMSNLGSCYEHGRGVPQNSANAVHWYRKAMDGGFGLAACNLGRMYELGNGINQNSEEAFRCYLKSAQLGNSLGMLYLGVSYEQGMGCSQSYVKAAEWYRKSADAGNGISSRNLAILYENGRGVMQDDRQAFFCYEKAAKLGDSDAMNDLGRFLQEGRGTEQNVVSAVYWYRQSAKVGNIKAMNNIGLCYENGVGVTQNVKAAVEWYYKSAAGGDEVAFRNLSRCFAEGIGVPVDFHRKDLLVEGCGAAQMKDFQLSGALLAQAFDGVEITNQRANAPEARKSSAPVADNFVSAVDQNLPKGKVSRPNTFAVVIANENYSSEPKVDFAHNDGTSMKNYLQQVIGLPESNIHFVKDATLNMIRREVNWLSTVAQSYNGEASIVFYYAGHGVPDIKKSTSYLLPSDGMANDIITGYALDDLYAQLAKSPSRSTLVFLDACFSGSQRNGESMSAVRAVGIRAKQGVPRGNMVVFSAAQGNETAHPLAAEHHGMFTYYLLKKIKEKAGKVTLGELGDYVTNQVRRKSTVDFTEGQTPSVHAASQLSDEWKNLYLGE